MIFIGRQQRNENDWLSELQLTMELVCGTLMCSEHCGPPPTNTEEHRMLVTTWDRRT